MQGTLGWRENPAAREYQALKLGRAEGETFLTELLPLTCRGIGVWPYKSLFPTKAEYIAEVRPDRIKWLRSEVSAFQPSFVICYGKGNWRHHEEIFSDVEFRTELDGKIRVGHHRPKA